LHAEAGAAERAAEILLDLGLRFLGRGALDAATDALGRARSLSVDPAVADRILDVLVQVHAAAGRVEDAFEVGEALLRRAPAAAAAQRVHLCLARVATLAGRPDQATRHLDAILSGVPEQVGGSILRAALAVNRRSPEEAEQLSIAALDHARSHGDADSVCEALLVRGRAARLRSATDAERWFEQAHQTAERDGLILWQVRALHELGTIDLLESGRTDRLSAAHELSTSLGAHETAAHVDLHLGILLAHRGDHDAAAKRLQSSLEYGVKLHLEGLRRIAAAQLGYVHALGGNGEAAEAAIASVVEDPLVDDADHIAQGLAKPFTRLLVEDRSGALELMDRAVVRSADRSWPQWGVRALLHAVEGVDSAADELTSVLPAETGRLQHAYLLFAVAVARGRAGDVVGASTAVAAGWERLGWQVAHRRFCLRQLGEAAARDGWGEPVSWLVEALEEFRGVPAVASACRRLIKEAGGTVPRAGRGESSVPPTLRARGVTSREMDVLKVLVEGSSNDQIAARLHLSRRTVEGHVTSLLAKTMAESRGQLVTRFANSVVSQP
jgi:DNA-binding CsgD family transcriptional regulator/tetratricopeptide (TPR) repeat protein